jgi:hypothetical protein
MEIKEFYEIQKKYNLSCYTKSNLELIMNLINKKGVKPPISTYNGFERINYQVMEGNKAIGYIRYPIKNKKENNKKNFRKKAIFSFNQVKKIENKE